MSILNSFSNSITNSTISRLSAPRSSMKLASSVSFSRSTPSSFSMMSFTFALLSSMGRPESVEGGGAFVLSPENTDPGGSMERRGVVSHDHPAVDHQHLAGDVRGEVGREEQNGVRDVVGLPDPL